MQNKKYASPLKSIRKYCLWCSNDQFSEIKLCPKTDCPFFPFRMGKKTVKGSLVKVIKKRCLDCGDGTAQEVRKCDQIDCAVFPYRNGKNPNCKTTSRPFGPKARAGEGLSKEIIGQGHIPPKEGEIEKTDGLANDKITKLATENHEIHYLKNNKSDRVI